MNVLNVPGSPPQQCAEPGKGVFFGWVKTNSGVFACLVLFIWAAVKAVNQTLMGLG